MKSPRRIFDDLSIPAKQLMVGGAVVMGLTGCGKGEPQEKGPSTTVQALDQEIVDTERQVAEKKVELEMLDRERAETNAQLAKKGYKVEYVNNTDEVLADVRAAGRLGVTAKTDRGKAATKVYQQAEAFARQCNGTIVVKDITETGLSRHWQQKPKPLETWPKDKEYPVLVGDLGLGGRHAGPNDLEMGTIPGIIPEEGSKHKAEIAGCVNSVLAQIDQQLKGTGCRTKVQGGLTMTVQKNGGEVKKHTPSQWVIRALCERTRRGRIKR